MGLADEIDKLEKLRQLGSLTDDEFRLGKERLLNAEVPAGQPVLGDHLSQQLQQIRQQNELTNLDHDWELEQQQYFINGPRGRKYVPTAGMGLAVSLTGCLIGAIWTFIAMNAGDFQGKLGLRDPSFSLLMPAIQWFGILIAGMSVLRGFYLFLLASNYLSARRKYLQCRDELKQATKSFVG